MSDLRPPAFAGSFYPAEKEELGRLIKRFISDTDIFSLGAL